MSRLLIPIVAIITAASASPLRAQQSAPVAPKTSALTAMRSFGRERGDTLLSRVVGVVGFHGQDQPGQWMLLQNDVEVPAMLHEYVMQGGRIVAQRRFTREPGQDLPTIPIAISKIAIDSPQAFALANQAARKAGIGFDSMNYQLRCRDLRNEPVWVLSLMDSAHRITGTVYLSALTGETLRTIWNRPGMITTTAQGNPPAAQKPATRETPRGLIPQLVDRIEDRRSSNNPASNQPQYSGPGAYAVPGMTPQGAFR